MPVLTEPTAQERKRGRGWLWLLAAMPVLLVLFVVGTTVQPLVLEVGGLVVYIRGEWDPEGIEGNGFHSSVRSPEAEVSTPASGGPGRQRQL